MRVNILLYSVVSLANAALVPRDQAAAALTTSVANTEASTEPWKPMTHTPEFFSLKVDDLCKQGEDPNDCKFSGMAIRLQDGVVIATPYNKWWDPKLPIFFVDDDTQAYTVSRIMFSHSYPKDCTDDSCRSARSLFSST
jgi:hypothetical protein